jgi:hypothetical protein
MGASVGHHAFPRAPMKSQIWNLVFLAGFIVYVGIRGAFKQRTRRNEKLVARVDALEKTLMALVIPGGLLLPIVYVCTSWLSFADYRLQMAARARGLQTRLEDLSVTAYFPVNVHGRALIIEDDEPVEPADAGPAVQIGLCPQRNRREPRRGRPGAGVRQVPEARDPLTDTGVTSSLREGDTARNPRRGCRLASIVSTAVPTRLRFRAIPLL